MIPTPGIWNPKNFNRIDSWRSWHKAEAGDHYLSIWICINRSG